jgi:acetyl-CoA acyltransferase
MRDVYIVAAARTAVGKAKKGTLANYRPEDMAAVVVDEVLQRAQLPPEAVQDLVLGCAIPEGEQGMNLGRIVVARSILPDTTTAMTLTRYCASGLESIAVAASKIQNGMLHTAVAGGVESMSHIPITGLRYAPNPTLCRERPEVYTAMGHCGDNVARDFDISREELDQWALDSHTKAFAAIDSGAFKEQIVPLPLPNGNGKQHVFKVDEGPRRDTSLEGLAALKPAFGVPGYGRCTAGNSSQTSDGAAAVLLLHKDEAEARNMKPLARLVSYAVAGDAPKYLGPAQLVAIRDACDQAGVALGDIDLFEINEAFASVAIFVTRELGIDLEKVNVNGGAIALGHPLGCTGAKLTVQMIHELQRRGLRYGVVTMCIGGGMGAAGVVEVL